MNISYQFKLIKIVASLTANVRDLIVEIADQDASKTNLFELKGSTAKHLVLLASVGLVTFRPKAGLTKEVQLTSDGHSILELCRADQRARRAQLDERHALKRRRAALRIPRPGKVD